MDQKSLNEFKKGKTLARMLSAPQSESFDSLTEEELIFWYIEAYIQEELNPREKENFEKELEKDADLLEELAAHKTSDNILKMLNEDQPEGIELSEQEIHKSLEQELLLEQSLLEAKRDHRIGQRKQNRRVILFSLLAAAASLVVLFSVILNQGQARPEKLFAENYEYPLPGNILGTEEDELRKKAETYLSKKDCSSFLGLIGSVGNSDSLMASAKMLFYQGICELEQGESSEAISIFAELNPTSRRYFQMGQWYTALALLKSGKTSESIIQLDKLVNDPRHPYHEEAKKLKKQLGS
ncbi:MAG: hypothetical protein MRZ79_08885 [Bacteroidia bacterium]|nr:hypothetical protein [Bacteroidia bacterium]